MSPDDLLRVFSEYGIAVSRQQLPVLLRRAQVDYRAGLVPYRALLGTLAVGLENDVIGAARSARASKRALAQVQYRTCLKSYDEYHFIGK